MNNVIGLNKEPIKQKETAKEVLLRALKYIEDNPDSGLAKAKDVCVLYMQQKDNIKVYYGRMTNEMALNEIVWLCEMTKLMIISGD